MRLLPPPSHLVRALEVGHRPGAPGSDRSSYQLATPAQPLLESSRAKGMPSIHCVHPLTPGSEVRARPHRIAPDSLGKYRLWAVRRS